MARQVLPDTLLVDLRDIGLVQPLRRRNDASPDHRAVTRTMVREFQVSVSRRRHLRCPGKVASNSVLFLRGKFVPTSIGEIFQVGRLPRRILWCKFAGYVVWDNAV